MTDPFAVLGLPARHDLTDEDVRAAWRRIAAATHPDRDDGGDQARYSAAAAAYDTLRTAFGRGEALADLGATGTWHAKRAPRHHHASHAPLPSKRTLLSAAISAATATAASSVGWTPATIALLVGAATWLLALHAKRP